MLFLHGYLSSKEAFTAQIEYFSRFFRVTAFDFLGFGHSKKLTEPFSVSDYAAWTKETLSLLGVEKPIIVAHSFGARVAVKLASEYPLTVEKMLLTGAAGVIMKRGFSYRAKVKAYRLVKRFAPKFAEKRFGSKEYRALSPVMRESYKKIVNEDLRKDAARVCCPILFVTGEEDCTTPLRETQAYLQAVQNGKIRVMQGGHFAFAEHPIEFNLILEEFIYG